MVSDALVYAGLTLVLCAGSYAYGAMGLHKDVYAFLEGLWRGLLVSSAILSAIYHWAVRRWKFTFGGQRKLKWALASAYRELENCKEHHDVGDGSAQEDVQRTIVQATRKHHISALGTEFEKEVYPERYDDDGEGDQ